MLIAVLLLAALQASQCPELLGLARSSYSARRYEAAVTEFNQALAVCANPDPILLSLGQAQLMAQKFADSARSLERYLEAHPEDIAAMKLRADALYLGGDDTVAERVLNSALKIDPDNTAVHYTLGRIYYQQSRYTEGVEQFSKVIVKEPDSYRGHDNLALCYEALSQDDLALKHYLKALALVYKDHPDYDWAYGNFANFMLRRGENTKAFQLAAEAAKRNPYAARNFFFAGKALFKLEKVEESVRWLERARNLDPQYREARYLLAQVYRKLGRPEEAERELAAFKQLQETPRSRK